MFESVLEWHKVNQTYPSVSRAAIIDNLGDTEFSFKLPLPSLGAQVFLVWLVSFIHVSSIFIILILSLSFFIKVKAYYCLSTNDRSELAYGFSFLALMKLYLKSYLSISFTSFKLTYRPESSLTLSFTIFELLIEIFCSIRSIIASFIWILCLQTNFSFSLANLALLGSYFYSHTRSRTNYSVTLNLLAIST